MTPELIVPARFRGPAQSGNGGWTAGALAERVEGCPTDHTERWPVVEVTLRRPPPLDTPLTVTAVPGAASCDVAEARVVPDQPTAVAPVPWESAAAAEASYFGLRAHPFPSCFACGPDREPGDGLRIFPGAVDDADAGRRRVAATWTPHPSVTEDYHAYAGAEPRVSVPVTWAALDCIGGWSADLEERPMVLGRMTALIEGLPVVGRPHVVVGEFRGVDGRKSFTGASLYDAQGALLARAEHVWIAVDPAAFESRL